MFTEYAHKYAAAMLMTLTALPAGGLPVVTASVFTRFAMTAEPQPDTPWWAWLILLVVAAIPVSMSVAAAWAFFRLLRHVRSLEGGAKWLSLGRGAWQVLMYCGLVLGVACGFAFTLILESK